MAVLVVEIEKLRVFDVCLDLRVEGSQNGGQPLRRFAHLLDEVLLAQAGLVDRNGNGALQAAVRVDQPDFERIDAAPYAPARNIEHLLDGQIASFGDQVRKGLVDPIHAFEHHGALSRSQSAEDAQIGRAVALDRIDGDAQFPLHGVARIEQHAEYADRTRQREPVGYDGIRRSGDVVSAAGCIGAHRNDHRFFGFEQFHFAPDHVRGQSAAAGRIHPHDDRLHPIVQP